MPTGGSAINAQKDKTMYDWEGKKKKIESIGESV